MLKITRYVNGIKYDTYIYIYPYIGYPWVIHVLESSPKRPSLHRQQWRFSCLSAIRGGCKPKHLSLSLAKSPIFPASHPPETPLALRSAPSRHLQRQRNPRETRQGPPATTGKPSGPPTADGPDLGMCSQPETFPSLEMSFMDFSRKQPLLIFFLQKNLY
jgi:hypothetical protein